jgi:hypothetical protein
MIYFKSTFVHSRKGSVALLYIFVLFYSGFMNVVFIHNVLNILVCVGQTFTCGLHYVA